MEQYIELNYELKFLFNIENESLDGVRKKSKNLVEFYNRNIKIDLGEE